MDAKKQFSNKKFGYFVAFIFFIFWVFICFSNKKFELNAPFFCSIFFIFLSEKTPSLLKPLKTIWMNLGYLMGRYINPLIMIILFYFVITPFAVFIRTFFQYDPLKIRRNKETYWQSRKKLINYKVFFTDQF